MGAVELGEGTSGGKGNAGKRDDKVRETESE